MYTKTNLNFYYLWLILTFLSMKTDVNVPSKSNKQKNSEKTKLFFVGILSATDEKRVRIRKSEERVHGSGSVPKYQGYTTLLLRVASTGSNSCVKIDKRKCLVQFRTAILLYKVQGIGSSLPRFMSRLLPQLRESRVMAFSHLWCCSVPGLYLHVMQMYSFSGLWGVWQR